MSKRTMKLNLVLALGLSVGLQVGAATRTWVGAGDTQNASEAANWSDSTLPASTDHVVLDGSSTKNLLWDAGVNGLPDTVASWTQTEDYTGTVTIRTRYPGQGAFEVFTITGDGVVANGTWTHANDNNDTATSPPFTQHSRLNVSVGGNFTLGSAARIDVVGRGYNPGRGPGRSPGSAAGGGHGETEGGFS